MASDLQWALAEQGPSVEGQEGEAAGEAQGYSGEPLVGAIPLTPTVRPDDLG